MWRTLFDILGATLTVVSLYLAAKYNWAWILYCFACILYTIAVGMSGLIGLTIMGIVLFFVGIRNYILGKKKK